MGEENSMINCKDCKFWREIRKETYIIKPYGYSEDIIWKGTHNPSLITMPGFGCILGEKKNEN